MRKIAKQGIALVLTLALSVSPVYSGNGQVSVNADAGETRTVEIGKLADKITGTWSYWVEVKMFDRRTQCSWINCRHWPNKGTYRMDNR